MSRYAPWIEPAILNEWIEIMRGYAANPVSWDEHLTALRWLEPEHDTGIVRDVDENFAGADPRCSACGRDAA